MSFLNFAVSSFTQIHFLKNQNKVEIAFKKVLLVKNKSNLWKHFLQIELRHGAFEASGMQNNWKKKIKDYESLN
jgi:hypothetical protein